MNLKDLKTLADVSRWLSHHVEWNDEASSDMGTRAAEIIDKVVTDEGRRQALSPRSTKTSFFARTQDK